MKTFGFSPKMVRSVMLPNGEYHGTWSGSVVTLQFDGYTIEIKTSDTIRGINIPCVVTVNGGEIEITTRRLESEQQISRAG